VGAGLLFASFSFSKTIPPAEPARPTVASCVVAFRDRACFGAGGLVVGLGPGDDDLDAMTTVMSTKLFENSGNIELLIESFVCLDNNDTSECMSSSDG
jgi:ethanolamine ammonia-lyase large subunit